MTKLKREDIHNFIINEPDTTNAGKRQKIFDFVALKFHCDDIDTAQKSKLDAFLQRRFFGDYFRRWNKSHRVNGKFVRKNEKWLGEYITYNVEGDMDTVPSTSGMCNFSLFRIYLRLYNLKNTVVIFSGNACTVRIVLQL